MNITDAQAEYADQVRKNLAEQGFRVVSDLRNEKIGYKIRQAQLQKVPYMLIVGEKEQAAGMVAVRHRSAGDQGAMALEDFIARAQAEIAARK